MWGFLTLAQSLCVGVTVQANIPHSSAQCLYPAAPEPTGNSYPLLIPTSAPTSGSDWYFQPPVSRPVWVCEQAENHNCKEGHVEGHAEELGFHCPGQQVPKSGSLVLRESPAGKACGLLKLGSQHTVRSDL